jgi:septal ring factor EnvC (AmiA/AmiB activator)
VNIRARRVLVKAFRVLASSATESERALGDIRDDTQKLNSWSEQAEKRLTSISTEIKAVRSDIQELKDLLREQPRRKL